MGKLADLISERSTTKKGPPCETCTFVGKLDEETRVDFDAALADKGLFATDLFAILKEHFSFTANVESLRRHRKGECLGGRTS